MKFARATLAAATLGLFAIATPAAATDFSHTSTSTSTTAATSTASSAATTGSIDLRGSNSGGSYGNSRTFSDGTTNVTATGWSYDGHSVREGALGQWSHGLGVNNSSGDNSHTVDNSGWLDFVVFQFDSAVALDSVSFSTGWHGMYDTDATIGVSNLMTPFTGDLSSFTFFDANGRTGSNIRDVNLSGLIGTTWLIGASATNTDGRTDGFKIAGLGFTSAAGAVPEPATWAMMLLGFGFAGAAMRRGKTQQRMRVAYA